MRLGAAAPVWSGLLGLAVSALVLGQPWLLLSGTGLLLGHALNRRRATPPVEPAGRPGSDGNPAEAPPASGWPAWLMVAVVLATLLPGLMIWPAGVGWFGALWRWLRH